jgi:Mrp family chromosome partitioning ATPase
VSRNFDLLAQIEVERQSGVEVHRTRLTSDKAVPKDEASSSTGDMGQDEIMRLVQSVFLASNETSRRQVVFCGVDEETSSGSVCASTARMLAASSARSVCLVDANLRSPHLSRILGVKTAPFAVKLDSLRGQCVDLAENLWFAGARVLGGNGLTLPPIDELRSRLAELLEHFDYVLIDAPGAGGSGDAAALGQAAGAAILVVEANRTRRLTARKAKETLESAGVELIGTVLHNRLFPIPEGIYKRL